MRGRPSLMLAGLSALALSLLAGCSAASRLPAADPMLAAIEACAARLDPAALDPAALDEHLACLSRLYNDEPLSLAVHLAFAQAMQARALGWPDPARDDLHAARGWALRGLALNPSVADRLERGDGRFGPEAVGAIGLPEVELVYLAVSAWARWLHERGVAGAAIDLPAVAALARRARVLGADHPQAWASLARALSLARRLDPAAEADEDLPEAWARALRSSDARVRLDYIELYLEAEGPSERSRQERAALASMDIQGRGLRAFEAALIRERAARSPEGEP